MPEFHISWLLKAVLGFLIAAIAMAVAWYLYLKRQVGGISTLQSLSSPSDGETTSGLSLMRGGLGAGSLLVWILVFVWVSYAHGQTTPHSSPGVHLFVFGGLVLLITIGVGVLAAQKDYTRLTLAVVFSAFFFLLLNFAFHPEDVARLKEYYFWVNFGLLALVLGGIYLLASKQKDTWPLLLAIPVMAMVVVGFGLGKISDQIQLTVSPDQGITWLERQKAELKASKEEAERELRLVLDSLRQGGGFIQAQDARCLDYYILDSKFAQTTDKEAKRYCNTEQRQALCKRILQSSGLFRWTEEDIKRHMSATAPCKILEQAPRQLFN